MFVSYAKPYILAGRATFHVKTAKGLYHYKVNRKESRGDGGLVWFIYASLNNEDWKYLGMITSNMRYMLTAKSEWAEADPIALAFGYLWKLAVNEEDSKLISVEHNGICSKCGRELSDEESVSLGIGPTCRKNLGI